MMERHLVYSTCKIISQVCHLNLCLAFVRYRVKSRLQELLQMDRELTSNEHREINPCGARSIEAALHLIGNPVQCCLKVYEQVSKLVEIIRAKRDDTKSKSITFNLSKHFQNISFVICFLSTQMVSYIMARHGN